MSPFDSNSVRIFAPWRLCVSHPFRAETYRDLCNSSLQLFCETNPCARRGSSRFRVQSSKCSEIAKRTAQTAATMINVHFYQTNPLWKSENRKARNPKEVRNPKCFELRRLQQNYETNPMVV